jgi:N-methylhydantoinase A
MHACALAEELEIGEIVVPPYPGMFSALGLLTADLFHDYSRAMVRRVNEVAASEVESLFEEMEITGRETLLAEGVEPGAMSFLRQLDLRYLGQSYELSIDVTNSSGAEVLQQGVEAFHGRHREIYGYGAEEEPVELVNVRVRAVGEIPQLQLREWAPTGVAAPSVREVFFEDHDSWLETPVYDRGTLPSGGALDGPAIVEQYDSTTVVYPSWRMDMDRHGIMSLRRIDG